MPAASCACPGTFAGRVERSGGEKGETTRGRSTAKQVQAARQREVLAYRKWETAKACMQSMETCGVVPSDGGKRDQLQFVKKKSLGKYRCSAGGKSDEGGGRPLVAAAVPLLRE